MFIALLACLGILCAWLCVVVLLSLFGQKYRASRIRQMSSVIRPVVIASMATAPAASILMLLDRGGYDPTVSGVLTELAFGMVFYFFALLLANVLLGPVSSAILQRLNLKSRLHYAVAGAMIPLTLGAAYCAYDWLFGQSGPFCTSLRDQVTLKGFQAVAPRVLGSLLIFSAIGALSGYTYRVAMRSNIVAGGP